MRREGGGAALSNSAGAVHPPLLIPETCRRLFPGPGGTGAASFQSRPTRTERLPGSGLPRHHLHSASCVRAGPPSRCLPQT